MTETKTEEEFKPWLESYPQDVPPHVNLDLYPDLASMFDSVSRTYAENTAYISMGVRVTYQEVRQWVDALASFLQDKLKLGKGDSLAVVMPNLIQYPVTVFAAIRCGIRVVNVNPLYTPREMEGVLRDSGAAAVVALETCARGILSIRENTKLKHVIVTGVGDLLGTVRGGIINFAARYYKHLVPLYDAKQTISFKHALKAGRQCSFTRVELSRGDVAFLQYTGGTTGKPKGAMLTHGNIVSNVAQILGMYGMMLRMGRETMLTPLPLYHVFAMTIDLMLAFAIGVTNILVVDPRQLKVLGKIIDEHPEISIVVGVNTLYNGLMNHGILKKDSLPYLKLAVGGGAAIQSGVADRFFELTGKHILEGYGLTECSPVTCVNPHTKVEFTGSIGIPLPDTLARIVDTETGEVITSMYREGELEFKGPQVMLGYFNNDADNISVRDGEWLRTGDVAIWQEGGYLKIIDRIKDLILVSGFNVFPSEIEDVVSNFGSVAECACVGVPSETTGEAIKLFVVKKDPHVTADDIKKYCRKYLTGYKMPRIIEFVDRLPKSAVGKVMRRYLKQNRLSD